MFNHDVVINRSLFATAHSPTAAELCDVATHMGEMIESVFRAKRPKITVQAFADEIGRSRENVYSIFRMATVDSGLLRRIGKVLDHDFLQYARAMPQALGEPAAVYGTSRPDQAAATRSSMPLQIMVSIDPADPDAQRKIQEILRIVNEK